MLFLSFKTRSHLPLCVQVHHLVCDRWNARVGTAVLLFAVDFGARHDQTPQIAFGEVDFAAVLQTDHDLQKLHAPHALLLDRAIEADSATGSVSRT